MTTQNITRKAMIHLYSVHNEVASDADASDADVSDADASDENETEAESEAGDENNDEAEKQELSTEGVIRVAENRIEIEYFETELTGMEGSCTCISFERDNPEVVSMIRTGSVTTALVFEKNKRHICAYNTDFIAFEICVKATEVKNIMTELGGEIVLDYGIEFRGASTERTFLKITAAVTDN